MAADEKTLKPKSFRIDDLTADKFKEIANKIGGNQQETLSKLIEAFEFQSGKVVLTDKKADIEEFERYITALTRMYMGSLEDNQNLTATVRTEYEAQLKSKDATIQNLQEQMAAAKQVANEAQNAAAAANEECEHMKKDFDRLQSEYNAQTTNLKQMLSDKEQLNKALTDSHNELKSKVDSMTVEFEHVTALRAQNAKLAAEKESLEKNIAELEKSLEAAQNASERDMEILKQRLGLEKERELLAMEKKYQEEKQTEINRYQQKYLELVEQLKNGGTEK